MKSILLVVLNLLSGTGIQAEVLPLRPSSEEPESGSSVNTLAPARQQWVRQSPLPTGRNLTGVSWATTTHGIASGEALTLVETFDGGATWRDVNLGSQSCSSPFYNVLCKDPQNYFVIGKSAIGSRDIFRTIACCFRVIGFSRVADRAANQRASERRARLARLPAPMGLATPVGLPVADSCPLPSFLAT